VLSPVLGRDGLPVHYVGVQTDVTARVQAERRTAGVLDRIEDAFFALDREHRLRLVNRRLEALLERPAAQLVGAGVWETFPDGVGTRLQARAMRAAREMTPSIFREYWPTGARWIEARMFPAREGVSVYLRDVTEDHLRERRLAHLARHDPVTGLPNRDAAIELLGEACSAARRGTRCLAVASIDLDRFGAINEARGHRAGDAVLKEVAARLVGSRPQGASVARMGADEFVAVLDTDDADEALAACDGMLAALSAPIVLADGCLRIGASGRHRAASAGRRQPDALLANASVALLVARQEGAGRARLFDAALGRAQRAPAAARCAALGRVRRRLPHRLPAEVQRRRASCADSRRSRAGRAHRSAPSRRTSSFRSPRSAAPSSRSGAGCWTGSARSCAPGWTAALLPSRSR
jgi:diguanylate cyclase (GGDEF)-like protein